jgi:hypothetical protein
MKEPDRGDPREFVDDGHGGYAAHGCEARAGERAVAGHPVLAATAELQLHRRYVRASLRASSGDLLDLSNRKLSFSTEKFIGELEEALAHFEEPDYFDVSPDYSAVYRRFLELDLSDRAAIRGQLEGPISFGFNVLDENDRPILFNDTVRPFMLEFMAKRISVQLQKLKARNANAFMFVDEPGMQFLFSALAGYGDIKAKADLDQFFSMVDRPRGIHLCGNPDWDFMLGLDIDVLSLDVYTNARIFSAYAASIRKFLDRGGTIVWGIVPTGVEAFEKENFQSLIFQLEDVWRVLRDKGIDFDLLLSRSLLSPATCCLVNPDREKTVERAFDSIRQIARLMREHYRIGP